MKFEKRPEVIEAIFYDGNNEDEIAKFFPHDPITKRVGFATLKVAGNELHANCWITRDFKIYGEDLFKRMYREASPA